MGVRLSDGREDTIQGQMDSHYVLDAPFGVRCRATVKGLSITFMTTTFALNTVHFLQNITFVFNTKKVPVLPTVVFSEMTCSSLQCSPKSKV